MLKADKELWLQRVSNVVDELQIMKDTLDEQLYNLNELMEEIDSQEEETD